MKNNTTKIVVGSRLTPLALTQVKEVFSLLSRANVKLSYELKVYQTAGDKDKKTPLSANPPDDFFTNTLDSALLKGKIDIAVHSAKDLPKRMHQGLEILALTPSIDETDVFVGKQPIAKLKKGAKIGTSSTLRTDALLALNPKIKTVNIRGNINERLAMVDQGKLDGIVVASCALKRLGLANRITEILPYEATPLQGQLAVIGRKGGALLKELFSAIDVRLKYGKVTLVGAGPGHPDLITVQGVQCLKKAGCVFYDYLIDKKLLEYAPQAEKVYVGKRKGEHTISQPELSKMIRMKALEGKYVVRLKGGDPLIFGRGSDEIEYLKAYHIDVDIVPGVSSATGIPALLGIPLTARGVSSSVAFISGHGEKETEKAPKPLKIPKVDTIVLLMGLTKLKEIVRSFKKAGWKPSTPFLIVSKGTTSEEKIVSGTLKRIELLAKKAMLEPPALMVVGEVVKFLQPKESYRDTVLYLGTHPQKYQALGDVIHYPMISISKAKFTPQDAANLAESLSDYQMIIFTSHYAVKSFFEILLGQKSLLENLKNIDYVVIGPKTAQTLRENGIEPKVISKVETSEGLLSELRKRYQLKGMRILFPRSSLPNPFLKDSLTKDGAMVREVTIYDNTKPPKRDFSFQDVTKVVFTSPSAVKNFLSDYGAIPKTWRILCKGPVTQKALKDAGYESEVFNYDAVSQIKNN